MGYAIAVMAMVFVLLVGNVQLRESTGHQSQAINRTADRLAADMLRLASGVNNWHYRSTLDDGNLNTRQFGLVPPPDSRINAAIYRGRLWLWIPEQQGLVASLNHQSVSSALVATVAGGRLRMVDGTDMNISFPAGVAEGNIVYLN
ncbi:type IV pilus biogenesis protein PilM [Yersinia enterocolitica]|uniref:type IV pilus biogenesis protein PilM n=1 Tax=Yersinia enterocolitica TaxID=630 RepID=UPI00094B87AF|nr:type IV pilus biogenesis protein PilM [Yersinia enterocolitica]EKN4036014.1 type IV pilus biogenesis protein PilM [Yersinia enterocolitica]